MAIARGSVTPRGHDIVLTLANVIFDCNDTLATADFWRAALDLP